MSGPTPMMLGSFAFEAIGFGFNGLQRRVQTPWADIAVAQTLNQQQWTGPTSEEVTISGVLFNEEFGGQDSLDGIIAAANAGVPLMLVSGSESAGVIHGSFTIQGVSEERSFIDHRGAPRKNSYSITLKRYGDTGGGSSFFKPIFDLFG
ncbi:phage protein U [Shinella sp. BE166]|uniref:phage tail protein n=1 Tax=Shinella sp. BE166 TaxID=3373918 RepID=UPI003EBAFF16